MTKFASDIARLQRAERVARASASISPMADSPSFADAEAYARLLAIVEPLASLTPEQAQDIGEMLTDAAHDIDEDHAAPGLKAACLRASTIFSRLGES